MIPAFVIPHLANRAGWTLVHFLWQGALIAAVTAGMLRLLSGRTAQVRYVVGVCALFMMIVAPAGTFVFYAQAGSVLRGVLLRIAAILDPAVLSHTASAMVLSSRHSEWTMWVVYLWFAGVALSSLRIVAGWCLTRRLLQTASDAVPDSVKQTFAGMKSRMAFARPVRLLLSERIDGPAAIGWLKPVVLLPLTAITGLDAAQLQAVLAHELAHIRRHDFLINVLQQCVESLLFYHPAVWWLSRKIRTEREHVCDDLAVAVCGDPAVYAKALVELERNRSNIPSLAMAAARGSLKSRVRRIFGWAPEDRDWREAAMAAMFVLTVLIAVAWQTKTADAQAISVPSIHVRTKSILSPAIPPQEQGPVAVLAAALAAVAPSPAISAEQETVQNPAVARKAGIQGVVLSAGTGEPIAGAQLTITSAGALADFTRFSGQIISDEQAFAEGYRAGTQIAARTPVPTTDAQGRFAIENLDAGSYRVSVVAGGYVRQEYGRWSPGISGSTITLTAGQSLNDLVIRMTPTSTISGLIRNGTGRPAVDVPVQLLKATYNYTGQHVTQVVASSRTDDRGQYRLYWVAPGHYFLSAGSNPGVGARPGIAVTGRPTADSAPTATYSTTFFPGVPEMSTAGVIEVLPDTPVNADFILSEQSLYKVSGRVIDSTNGKPVSSAELSLVYRNPTGSSDSISGSSSYNAATGEFELRNVAPGSYTVQATLMQLSGATPPPNLASAAGPTYTFSTSSVALPPGRYISTAVGRGLTPITVTNADLRNVQVNVTPALSIKGKLTVDRQPQPTDLPKLRIQIRPSVGGVITNDPALPSAEVAADGTFQLDGVTPGEYRFTMSPVLASYYVKQVRFGATEALNTPLNISPGVSESLEVLLSPQVAQIDGTVTDDKGQPVQGVQAVLIPDAHRDRAALFRAVTTGPNGQFTIRGVAPGDYKVFAWELIESYGYYDAELLKRDEAKGQRIKIQDSDKLTVSVKMIPGGAQ